MKNKTGKIIGFVLGAAGFSFLFKVFILEKHSPEDELAPGIVLIAAIITGLVFAYVGNLVQKSIEKNN